MIFNTIVTQAGDRCRLLALSRLPCAYPCCVANSCGWDWFVVTIADRHTRHFKSMRKSVSDCLLLMPNFFRSL